MLFIWSTYRLRPSLSMNNNYSLCNSMQYGLFIHIDDLLYHVIGKFLKYKIFKDAVNAYAFLDKTGSRPLLYSYYAMLHCLQ